MSDIKQNEGFVRDEEMDVMSLLHNDDTASVKNPVTDQVQNYGAYNHPSTPYVKPNNTTSEDGKVSEEYHQPVVVGGTGSNTVSVPDEQPKRTVTPLDEMMKKESPKGIVVDTEEIDKGKERTSFENPVYNDNFKEGVVSSESELDELTEKAKLIYMKVSPRNAQEYRQMIDELYDTTIDNGVAIVPKDAKYIIPRQIREKTESGEKIINTAPITEDGTELEEVTGEKLIAEKNRIEKRESIINIIIDKTGFGGNISFTPEEEEKISKATEIRIKEVENLDLRTKRIKKASKSFLDTINEQKLVRSGSVTMTFVASGFSADMQGLTYGELADIALNPQEPLEYNKVYKKLSIIYNKMRNISCKPFESFDDFLTKFSYTDIDLALYGLMIATYPESNIIPLNCGNPNCRRDFDHRYATRSLLNLDGCSDKFLEGMKNIASHGRFGGEEIAKDAPVRNVKMIELPYSKYIVEIGIASAYEYLNKIIKLDNKEFFKKEFPDDYNSVMEISSTLLIAVRSVSVPSGDGEYYQFDEFTDVLRAIYTISPDEISILASIVSKMVETYTVDFAFRDVTCPHCKNNIGEVPVGISQLVFRTYQLQMSTEINVENILGL